MIKKAYSILEAVVAISIVSVIITASVTIINSSLSSLDENGSNLMATNLAKQGANYFRKVVKTNSIRFPGRSECKFVSLSENQCTQDTVIEDGLYDIGFNANNMQETLISAVNRVSEDEKSSGVNFNNSKLKVYNKCYNVLSIATDQRVNNQQNCFAFYSAENIDGLNASEETKFVRVIKKENNKISSKVYFFVVAKPELQFIEQVL